MFRKEILIAQDERTKGEVGESTLQNTLCFPNSTGYLKHKPSRVS